MPYATAGDTRLYVNIPDEVSDTKLDAYITRADRIIFRTITVQHRDSDLWDETRSTFPNIDGSNKDYFLRVFGSDYPIADTNFDGAVATTEVQVFRWTKFTDPRTKIEVVVQTVDARQGIVTLASAPTSEQAQKLTIDYHSYKYEVDNELLRLASVFLTAYLYGLYEYGLVPDTQAIGTFRMVHGNPYNRYWELYNQIMGIVRKRVAVRGDSDVQVKFQRERDLDPILQDARIIATLGEKAT